MKEFKHSLVLSFLLGVLSLQILQFQQNAKQSLEIENLKQEYENSLKIIRQLVNKFDTTANMKDILYQEKRLKLLKKDSKRRMKRFHK